MRHKQVYLASASPRRRELLDQIGLDYTVIEPLVDESRLDDVNPQAYTERVAIAKALYVKQIIESKQLQSLPIVAADTAVALDQQILGKPADKLDAVRMLNLLSDRTHQVFSSVCVIDDTEPQTITQISDVTFRHLSLNEIEEYWSSSEPADKAGGYGIQGSGAKFIKHLNGSYSGVMGLPLYELTALLENRQL